MGKARVRHIVCKSLAVRRRRFGVFEISLFAIPAVMVPGSRRRSLIDELVKNTTYFLPTTCTHKANKRKKSQRASNLWERLLKKCFEAVA